MALIGVILLLAGWGVWALGRHGFAVGSHPFCNACGFNLFGLPEERARCPECGADILADGAIRVGYRQRVMAAMVVGAGIAVVGAGLAGISIVSWWPTFDGSRYKPLAWLERDMDSSNRQARARACTELERRLHGALSAVDVDKLAQVVLKWQADPAVAWDTRWGDLVQSGHAAGNLSAALWEKYLVQAMQVTAHVRPRVRMDDPVPIGVSCRLRAGTAYEALRGMTVKVEAHAALGRSTGAIEGRAVALDRVPMPMEWVMLWLPGDEGAAKAGNGEGWPAGIPTGKQVLTLTVTARAEIAGKSGNTVKAERREMLSLALEVLERQESSVMLVRAVPGVDAEAEWERAVRVRGPYNDKGELLLDRAGSVRLWVAGPPACASFRAMLRQDGREWGLARFMVRADEGATVPLSLPAMAAGSSPHDGAAEIICVPEPLLAVGTVDVLTVWGAEVKRSVLIHVPQ